MSVPLALLAGAALASNPRIVPPGGGTFWSPSPEKKDAESAVPSAPPQARHGKLGPESPELLALRLAETSLFEDSVVHRVDELEDGYMPPTGDPTLRSDVSGIDFLTGLHLPDLPVERHPHVEKYVNYFSSNATGRGLFTTWLERSGRYRPIISAALAAHNLPKDLEALVFIESGMWPTARSSAGAQGLWQFMPETARAYGLTVSPEYDERRSIWRASEAAAQHLSDLHARYKSWDLALAAYNFGSGNLESRMTEFEANDFWALATAEGILPEETRRYVPKVLAIAVLLNNLDQFGFDQVKLEDPISAVAFEVPPGTSLKTLARAAGTSAANIKALNPELLGSVVPDRGSPIAVHVPRSSLARARVMLPRLLGGDVEEIEGSVSDTFDWGTASGAPSDKDTDVIAASPASLRLRARPAPSAPVVAPVDVWVPVKVPKPAPAPAVAARAPEPLESREPTMSLEPEAAPVVDVSKPSTTTQLQIAFVPYRIQRGDTLAEIASRFGVTEREIVIDNQIANRSVIFRGQVIQVRDAKQTPARDQILYRVRPGDSLSRIAARLRTNPEKLIEENRAELGNPNLLQVGQVVRLTPG